MDIDNDILRLRYNYLNAITTMRDRIVKEATQKMREGLFDPNRRGVGVDREEYLVEAVQIGIAAANARMSSLAIAVFEALRDQVEAYNKATGEQRHMGTLYANLAIAKMLQGDVDQGIDYYLEAAETDVLAGVKRDESYALTSLLHHQWVRPLLGYACHVAQQAQPILTEPDFNVQFQQVDADHRFIFLAYLYTFQRNYQLADAHPTEFNYWQMYSALRNISAFLEVQLRMLSHTTTLGNALDKLYGKKVWWDTYNQTKAQIGTRQGSTTATEIQLDRALVLNATNDQERFWKSLLIAYITRNYTVHEMVPSMRVSLPRLNTMLGHVLHTWVQARSFS